MNLDHICLLGSGGGDIQVLYVWYINIYYNLFIMYYNFYKNFLIL